MKRFKYLLLLLFISIHGFSQTVVPDGNATSVKRNQGGYWADKWLKLPVSSDDTATPTIPNQGKSRVKPSTGKLEVHDGTLFREYATVDELTDSIVSIRTSVFKESFVYSGSDTFTLLNEPTNVLLVTINGQSINGTNPAPIQYIVTGTSLEILEPIGSGDNIGIVYSIAMVDASTYSKAETDALISQIPTSFVESIVPSSPAPSESGLYVPTESGTYTNFGGLVVDLSDGYSQITYDGSDFELLVVPIDLSGYATTATVEAIQESVSDLENIVVKNLFDDQMSNLQAGFRLSSNGGSLISNVGNNPDYTTSKAIPVVAGQWYTLSGAGLGIYAGPTPRGSLTPNSTVTAPLYAPSWTAVTGGYKFQSPITGNLFFDVKLKADLSDLLGDVMVNKGEIAQPYVNISSPEISSDYINTIELLKDSGVITEYSVNMINPDNIAFDRRYSVGGNNIVAHGGELICSSGLIEVEEGEFYAVSGDGIYFDGGNFQGGYFGESSTGAIGNSSIADITFSSPVAGGGKIFQVPIGSGIKYALLNLATNSDHDELTGDAQMERGEMASDYVPYSASDKISPNYLIQNSTAPTNELDKFTTFGNISYDLDGKLANFKYHYIHKDEDVVVLSTGTSLTARSIEHCTDHPQAAYRPPLMHSRNFASHIWDALAWEGQQYRRYDSGYFTETGTFTTSSNAGNWDDGLYRSGLTRYADGGSASVEFEIPEGAWQFNFIQRLDNLGSTSVTVTIDEGDDLVEVFDETTDTWVEANGYVFSQLNPTPVVIPTVNYINPSTGTSTSTSNYSVGGNTTYQDRLKFRCRNSTGLNSTASAKNVTISKTTGRLMYWGVEWSTREFMITYINAARGSHSSMIVANESLLHFQDNEVWNFEPDLILSEDPIHNSGASGVMTPARPSAYWGRVSENFFFANNDVSLKSRAADLGQTDIEWAIFNSSITVQFNGIDDDGNLITYVNSDGRAITALDAQMMAMEYIGDLHPEIVTVQAVKHWCNAGVACYGNLRTATEGSGKGGLTFTNEGGHWNDTGSRVMARIVLPILALYY